MDDPGFPAGTWDVVMTIRPAPDAEPRVTPGPVAERRMIGLYLNEVMRPAPSPFNRWVQYRRS